MDGKLSAAQVEHLPERQCFRIIRPQGEALLEYRWLAAGSLDFNRTYVPDTLRGQGLAEKLVRAGLRWGRQQEGEITASCWYVAKFLS